MGSALVLSSEKEKTTAVVKPRSDAVIDILLLALLRQLSQESGVGVYIKKGKGDISVQSDSCEQLK